MRSNNHYVRQDIGSIDFLKQEILLLLEQIRFTLKNNKIQLLYISPL